jgi:polysaccharide pyruvyl transferase WcaK-like protein
MKNKKVLLIGYYGQQNVGDDMFISLLVKHLKFQGIKEEDITVISPKKEQLEKNFNLNVVHPIRKNKFKLFRLFYSLVIYIKAIKSVDVIIYGGGTQIQEFGKNSYKPLIFKVIYLLANRLIYKKPVYHFAVGIDKMKTRLGRVCTKWIYNLSDKFILRDIYSYRYLKDDIKVKDIYKMKVRTDLAFNKEVTELLQKKKKLELKEERIKIGISLFPYYEKQSDEQRKQESFNQEITKFIKSLSQSKYEIHFIPFQSNVGNKDNKYMSKIIGNLDHIVFHEYNGDFKQTLKVISSMDICIGMRLHFVIFSLIALKPTIPLSYHFKLEQFTKTLHLTEHMVNLDEVTANLLNDKLNYIEHNYQNVGLQVKDGVDNEIQKGEGIFEELYKMVSGIKDGK